MCPSNVRALARPPRARSHCSAHIDAARRRIRGGRQSRVEPGGGGGDGKGAAGVPLMATRRMMFPIHIVYFESGIGWVRDAAASAVRSEF